ncbi:MAG: dATP/dGTP diphosphohydrolase domain-containing protein, partial [Candidatus Thorarchaeota archaeon]
KGEVYDQDSGCHHIGHAIWNLCALLELNYEDTPMIDEDLFRQRMKYWADKKQEKADD